MREFGKDAFNRMVAQATPLSDFLLRELGRQCDLTSAEGKAVGRRCCHCCRNCRPAAAPPTREATGRNQRVSQTEVERLCELRTIAPPAPAQAPRQSPAATFMKKLIRLILQKPALALRLPVDAPPAELPETRTLHRLVVTVRDMAEDGDGPPTYAVLLERLRNGEEDPLLRAAASDLMHEPFAEDEIEPEFAGTLAKFARDAQTDEIEALKAKARALRCRRPFGRRKARYVALLSTRGSPGG